MKLYKYISNEKALINVVDGNIKFATINSLNDPTELFPRLYEKELVESLDRLRNNGYSESDIFDLKKQERLFRILAPEAMMISAPKTIEEANQLIHLSIYDNVHYLKKAHEYTIDIMSTRCGVFCLSQRFDSFPMWAHYANNAKGFVIEFMDLENEFSDESTGILNRIEPIVYKTERTGISFNSGSYKSIFFEKDIDWEYEKEMRIVTEISSCNSEVLDERPIYTKKINKQHITKVMFGWNVADSDYLRLAKEINTTNATVIIEKLSIMEGKIRKF